MSCEPPAKRASLSPGAEADVEVDVKAAAAEEAAAAAAAAVENFSDRKRREALAAIGPYELTSKVRRGYVSYRLTRPGKAAVYATLVAGTQLRFDYTLNDSTQSMYSADAALSEDGVWRGVCIRGCAGCAQYAANGSGLCDVCRDEVPEEQIESEPHVNGYGVVLPEFYEVALLQKILKNHTLCPEISSDEEDEEEEDEEDK